MPYTKDGHGYRRTDTSYDAALSIRPSAASYESKCLATMKTHGALTPDEGASILEVSVLTVRPRFTALHQAGHIVDSGQRRPNTNGRKTIVWRLK
jgi:predicted ArsR family transcriptional regulator